MFALIVVVETSSRHFERRT